MGERYCMVCGAIIPQGHLCLSCEGQDIPKTTPRIRTNGDRIRSMVDDEDLLYAVGTNCNRCAYAEGRNGEACGEHCWEGNMEWLGSEVDTT